MNIYNFVFRPSFVAGVTLIIMAIFFIYPQKAHALCIGPKDLNGIWEANDGGIYYIRQVGNEVWWLGMSNDNGKNWTNVYKGTRNGAQVAGNWADVPKGKNSGNGNLNLNLQISGTSISSFTRGSTTGGFGGSRWVPRCDDVHLNPVNE